MVAKAGLDLVIGLVDQASDGLQTITGKIEAVGKIALGVGVAGIAALGAGLYDCTKEAMAAQEVTAQLEAVIQSTGGVAGVSAEQANTLATSLSEVTRFEDDAIVKSESLLLTFTRIGSEIFPQAQEAILNVSTALGTDLQSATTMVGKALNDPITGLTSLTRAGIQFTDSQKETIKAMVESGNVMGAQKIILGELETQFGGSARAAGQTFAGQMDILNNALGNVKEEIGNALLPVLTQLAVQYGPQLIQFAKDAAQWITTALIPAFQQIGEWCGVNLPPVISALSQLWQTVLLPALKIIGEFITTTLIPVLTEVVQWLSVNIPPAVQAAAKAWNEDIYPALKLVYEFINTYVVPILQDIIRWLAVAIPPAVRTAAEIWNTALLPALTAIYNFISTYVIPIIKEIIEWLVKNIPPAVNTARDVFNVLKSTIESIAAVIDSAIRKFTEIRTFLEGLHLPNPFAALLDSLNAIKNFKMPDFSNIKLPTLPKLPGQAFKGFGAVAKAAKDAYEVYKWLTATDKTVEWNMWDPASLKASVSPNTILNSERERLNLQLQQLAAEENANMTLAQHYDWQVRIVAKRNELLKLDRAAADLAKSQQQLAMLKEQMDLLNLIKEHGLDAESILKGVQFGLEGDLSGIVAAMSKAMAAIVEQAKKDLGIASPSAVFRGIGQQMMAGIAAGVARGAGLVDDSLAGVWGRGQGTAQRITSNSISNRNLTLNVYTSAGSENLRADFALLEALAG